MPSIVRGGRKSTRHSPQDAGGGRARVEKPARRKVLARQGAARGKAALIGNVPMSGEMVGWLIFLVTVLVLSVILMTGNRAQTLGNSFSGYLNARLGAVGMNLQSVRLKGVSPVAEADIKASLKAYSFSRGTPLALMDLNQVRAQVEKVGWVEHATVRRILPQTLIIDITERPRLAVWQYKHVTTVIDNKGQVIPEAHAVQFVDLPLVVGEGANEAASDLLESLRLKPQILSLIDAIVRVDTRRWDLRLKNGTLIKLPSQNEAAALDRLDSLISQKRILDQGFAIIDLTGPDLIVTPFSK